MCPFNHMSRLVHCKKHVNNVRKCLESSYGQMHPLRVQLPAPPPHPYTYIYIYIHTHIQTQLSWEIYGVWCPYGKKWGLQVIVQSATCLVLSNDHLLTREDNSLRILFIVATTIFYLCMCLLWAAMNKLGWLVGQVFFLENVFLPLL